MAKLKSGKRPKTRCYAGKDPKGKVRFATRRGANRALDAIWKAAIRGQFKGEKLPCRCYGPCRACKGFHLTSEPLRRYS